MSSETLQQIKALIEQRTEQAGLALVASKPHMDKVAALTEQIRALAEPLITPKDEGSVSLDVLGAATVKFSRDITRKADTEGLQLAWPELPEAVTKAFKFEAGIDLKALRALGEEDAAVAAQYYKSTAGDLKMSIALKVTK